jgi:hypothetical protein
MLSNFCLASQPLFVDLWVLPPRLSLFTWRHWSYSKFEFWVYWWRYWALSSLHNYNREIGLYYHYDQLSATVYSCLSSSPYRWSEVQRLIASPLWSCLRSVVDSSTSIETKQFLLWTSLPNYSSSHFLPQYLFGVTRWQKCTLQSWSWNS